MDARMDARDDDDDAASAAADAGVDGVGAALDAWDDAMDSGSKHAVLPLRMLWYDVALLGVLISLFFAAAVLLLVSAASLWRLS